jgi:hypothetical protein
MVKEVQFPVRVEPCAKLLASLVDVSNLVEREAYPPDDEKDRRLEHGAL